ncbi:hypothetical protein [Streptomyces sp. NPDC086010]|uniref:hypothetical protein n=1 Tax=Streptomyces sp. NPDC086010 TaxID=3365745 RepID=UPI0037D5F3A1
MTSTTDGAAGFLTALRSPDAEYRPGATSGPASPMELWPVAGALHDTLPTDVRDGWALRLYALLQERYGKNPVTGPPAYHSQPVGQRLSVIHDWQRHTVLPLVAETMPGAEAVPFSSLTRLHTEASAGRATAPDAWRTALHPFLLHLHATAFDRTAAYAEGHDGARAYALSQGRSPAEADAYGHEYAKLSCTANVRAFAEAHALALSDALALTYAADDRGAYVETFPGSSVRAVVRFCHQARSHHLAAGNPATRLSEGLLTALIRGRSLWSR